MNRKPFPLQGEVNLLVNFLGSGGESSEMTRWLLRVHEALMQTQAQYPLLFYGTDWLAFGHFMIALVFIGALRGIPFWWRLIDCSFGLFGFIPLWFCRKWAIELEESEKLKS